MSNDPRSLQPWLQPYADYLVAVARYNGIPAEFSSCLRTYAEQVRLWNNRQTNPYPVAYPGTSMHEQGRAFDLTGVTADELAALGQFWEQMGGRWGGHANDPIHFEA